MNPCLSARPGVATARRFRTRAGEVPHEGSPSSGIRVDAAERVWMPCGREGQRPIANSMNQVSDSGALTIYFARGIKARRAETIRLGMREPGSATPNAYCNLSRNVASLASA